MRKSLSGLLFAFVVFMFSQTLPGTAFAANPVLFFSDLTWGPRTGWDNTTAKGAAVTIWGRNFGTATASTTVNVGGVSIPADNATGMIAGWNVTAPAKGDKYITFWIPPTAALGAQTISVTVGGVTSNTLPLDITAWDVIVYLSPTGSNSNTGRTIASPKKDIYNFSYEYGPLGAGVDGQWIMYARGGTYTVTQPGYSSFLYVFGTAGSATRRKALIGYPGETATLPGTTGNIMTVADYSGGPGGRSAGRQNYITFSKLTQTGGATSIAIHGDYNRVVGCQFLDMNVTAWAGVIGTNNSQYIYIYGNHFRNCGGDSYKHTVYMKSNPNAVSGDHANAYNYVGWNEFNAIMGQQGGIIFVSTAGGAVGPADEIYIHNNYFHDSSDVYIYLGDNNRINSVYIYNNVFVNNALQSTNGNICVGPVGTGCNCLTAYIYNNTFYKTGQSPIINTTNGGRSFTRNNIFYASNGQNFIYHNGDSYAGSTSTNDLFYSESAYSIPSGSTAYQSGNPGFVNGAGADFHLTASSIAINTGTSTVTPIVTMDYEGLPRPQGAAFDIGAFEYVSGAIVSYPPATPTNFRVLP